MDNKNCTNRRIDVVDLSEDAPPVHKRHRRSNREERRRDHQARWPSWDDRAALEATQDDNEDDYAPVQPVELTTQDKVHPSRAALLASVTPKISHQINPHEHQQPTLMTYPATARQATPVGGPYARGHISTKAGSSALSLLRAARASNLLALEKIRPALDIESLAPDVRELVKKVVQAHEAEEKEFERLASKIGSQGK